MTKIKIYKLSQNLKYTKFESNLLYFSKREKVPENQ